MGERELVQLGNTETCPFKLRKICKSNSEVGIFTVLKACERNYTCVRSICCENDDTSLDGWHKQRWYGTDAGDIKMICDIFTVPNI